jgi:hypothetical protein
MMELSQRDESVTPFVELDFSVVGRTLPADHSAWGYVHEQ